MKILSLVIPVVAVLQIYFCYSNSAYIYSLIEGSLLPIIEDKKDAPQNEWSTSSNNVKQSQSVNGNGGQYHIEMDHAQYQNAASSSTTSKEVLRQRENTLLEREKALLEKETTTTIAIEKKVVIDTKDKKEPSTKIVTTTTTLLPQPYRLQLEKHRLRHADNAYTNHTSGEAEQRIVLFVHFHKAGGTSMIHQFRDIGYQLWNHQANGNPYGSWSSKKDDKKQTVSDQLCHQINEKQQPPRNAELVQFWRYSRPQFEAFLRDGRSQQLWPYCLPEPERIEDPQREARNGVEFVSMEWNFLMSDHFFKKDYLRNQAKIDVITILRDPYDRFLSNFHFQWDNIGNNYDDPMEWAHLDLIRKKGNTISFVKPNKRVEHLPHYQYGEITPHSLYFSVNYNKPNYYTAFLNGLAENTDDTGDTSVSFDFDYYAFGLNRTHLDIAKQRLESIFDAVLILERPETHGQLDQWFAFLGESAKKHFPHRNGNLSTKWSKTEQNFTREEFYRYNALDKELYDFALELSLSKI